MSQSQPPRQPPPRNPGNPAAANPKSGPTSNANAASSYHPQGYGTSEGLRRARRPYAARNTLVGLGILGFVGGVYWWSIYKVKQDDFSDIAPSAVSNNINRAEDHLSNNSEAVQQKLRQASNDAKERFNSASDSAEKEFKDLRSKFDQERANVESQASKAGDKAKETWNASRDELDRLASKTKEEASSLSSRGRQEADRLATQSRENFDSLTQSAKQNADKLSEQAQSSFSEVRSNAEKAWNKTRDSTNENVIQPARSGLDSAYESLPAAKDLNEGFKIRFLHPQGRVWEDYWAMEGRRRRAMLLAKRDGKVPLAQESSSSSFFS